MGSQNSRRQSINSLLLIRRNMCAKKRSFFCTAHSGNAQADLPVLRTPRILCGGRTGGGNSMNETVPTLSIIFMGISCVIGFGIPVVLLLYFRIKKHADILPFFIGCAVMIIFAFVLEASVHRIVLSSPAGEKIRNTVWLYALYGGIMAGIFEETGRFLAFKTILRKKMDNDSNALMYGAGHGGLESVFVLGITMINNIIWSILINSGNTAVLTGSLSGDILKEVEDSIGRLLAAHSFDFLLGGVERIFAVVLQISLSVLVWFAVKNRKSLWLYPAAVLIHFAVDCVTAVLSGSGVSTILIEAAVAVMAVGAALFAKKIWNGQRVYDTICT